MKDTVGLLNKAAFDQMKDGVMIINCARGGIVDEADLNEALIRQSRRCGPGRI